MSKSNIPFYKKAAFYKKTGWIALGVLKWTVAAILVCGFFAGGAAAGYVATLVKDEPVRSREEIKAKVEQNAITGFVYFRGGEPVGQLRTEEDRRMAELSEIPELVKNAFLAVEDNRFYEHPGVDFKGLMRAVIQQATNAPVQTGGSTITQQLARNVFLSLEQTRERKAKEIFLSLRLERLMSKDQIFLAYLNKIPFGNGSNGYNVFGIKAAAKGIFGIDNLNELNAAQAAYLAGLPQSPSSYSAYTGKGAFDEAGFKRAMDRQRLVLKRMLEEGVLTSAEYEAALAFDVKASLAPPSRKGYDTYPYLMLETERVAVEVLMKERHPKLKPGTPEYAAASKDVLNELLRGGYHIHTTIDKTMYESMRAIAENPALFAPDGKESGPEQIASVVIDNKTGAILGMMEGRSFFIEQMNLATQMKRQPGSSMKPIAAYAPAIEMGKLQPASVIDDAPIVLKDGVKKFHIPQNWNSKYNGLVTARTALNKSYNIPALKLFLDVVGIETAWDYARKLGITTLTESDAHAQTGVIGGLQFGTTVEEMTNAYAAFGNDGVFNDAYMIEKIVDSQGKVIYQHKPAPSTVFSKQTAYLMTSMLRTVITDPGSTAADLQRLFKNFKKVEVAGKTGSTQDDADAWFVGYSPDITVGVWAGYEQPKYKLSTRATGCPKEPVGCGTLRAKQIWAKVMDAAYELHPDWFKRTKFETPEGITTATVSSVSGKLPSEKIRAAGLLTTDVFNVKHMPKEEDDALVTVKYVMVNGKEYLPQDGTPSEFVREKTIIRRPAPLRDILKNIEEALQQLPAKDRKPIEHYIPVDYNGDPPSETDPRADDGKPPVAPTFTVAADGNHAVLTLTASPSPDVVGYRIYRSAGDNRFVRVAGAVIYAGEAELTYTDTLPGGGTFGYYVTAVDVAGNESPPGTPVYTDGRAGTAPAGPEQNGGNGSGNPGSPLPLPGENGSGEHPPASKPSAPENLAVKASGAGIELEWKKNPAEQSVERYEIYYSEEQNGTYRKIGTAKLNRFAYYALVYDGWYRVTAVNAAGESAPSKSVRYEAPDNE